MPEAMMSEAMIEVNHVTMRFHMNADRALSFKEYLIKAVHGKLKYKDFTALDDISFQVERGETLGLIGHNGAGKSTLLKVVSGIFKPTLGDVQCRGNIVPMLELGSGFDMDLSGKENIFLNGSILGYEEDFLKERYLEILKFSELGEFILEPIRNYSSGMIARLAFSIACLVEPEILIVDEILSVGDTSFQEKSRARMRQMMGMGTTVLFVSHSMALIRELCDRVLWLDHGHMVMLGETDEVCDAYEAAQKGDSPRLPVD